MNDLINKNRVAEIDFFRGLCIVFMILDHIMFFSINYSYVLWGSEPSIIKISLQSISTLFYFGKFAELRYYIRISILIIFFLIAGISCSFSKDNKIRVAKLAGISFIITFSTLVISKTLNIFVLIDWGVIHCYTVCLLIYMLLSKFNEDIILMFSLIFLIISICLIYFKPTLVNTNILMPFGIPSKEYDYSFEYFPVLKWIGVYFIGVYLGKSLYKEKQTYIRILDKDIFYLIRKIGQHGAIIYLIHFPIIILFIKFIGFV